MRRHSRVSWLSNARVLSLCTVGVLALAAALCPFASEADTSASSGASSGAAASRPQVSQSVRQVCLGTPTSTITLPNAVAAGDDLALVVSGQGYDGSAPSVSSVSDPVNGQWSALVNDKSQTTDSHRYLSYAVYQIAGAKAAPAGLTVTVNQTAGQSAASAVLVDVTGGPSVKATALSKALPSSGQAIASPTVSAAAGDLAVGLFGVYTAGETLANGSGWTADGEASNCTAAVAESQTVGSAGALAAPLQSSSAAPYYGGLITFSAPTAGGASSGSASSGASSGAAASRPQVSQSVRQVCLGTPTSTITLPNAVAAGDDLALVVSGQGYDGSAPSVSSVSDPVNGQWSALVNDKSQTTDSHRYLSYAVYQIAGAKAAPAGLTVTVNQTAGQSAASAVLVDVTGGPSVKATALSKALPSSGQAIASPTVSAAAGDLAVGLFGVYTAGETLANGSGWTADGEASNCTAAVAESQTVGSAGALAAPLQSSSAAPYYGGLITFSAPQGTKAAAGPSLLPPLNTSAPTISGSALQGSTLTASPGRGREARRRMGISGRIARGWSARTSRARQVRATRSHRRMSVRRSM